MYPLKNKKTVITVKAGVGKGIVTFNDVKESVAIFAYCFSMLTVIRVCLQSTRERASGSSASGDSARGMEFLYYHLLSPRYGVPLLPFAFYV
jgi:hypothetical protein